VELNSIDPSPIPLFPPWKKKGGGVFPPPRGWFLFLKGGGTREEGGRTKGLSGGLKVGGGGFFLRGLVVRGFKMKGDLSATASGAFFSFSPPSMLERKLFVRLNRSLSLLLSSLMEAHFDVFFLFFPREKAAWVEELRFFGRIFFILCVLFPLLAKENMERYR